MKKVKKVEKKTQDETETQVVVSVPSCIQIELVQGNELRNYEIFFSITSLLSSIAVGFWTTYASTPSSPLLFSALIFSLLTLICGAIAVYYRSRLYTGKIKKVASLDIFRSE